jgi:hypothetical protein
MSQSSSRKSLWKISSFHKKRFHVRERTRKTTRKMLKTLQKNKNSSKELTNKTNDNFCVFHTFYFDLFLSLKVNEQKHESKISIIIKSCHRQNYNKKYITKLMTEMLEK